MEEKEAAKAAFSYEDFEREAIKGLYEKKPYTGENESIHGAVSTLIYFFSFEGFTPAQ